MGALDSLRRITTVSAGDIAEYAGKRMYGMCRVLYLQHRRTQPCHSIVGDVRPSRFFFDPMEKEEIVSLVSRLFPLSISRTIEDAEDICAHRFDLLGSSKTDLGPTIDWHRDFKSGYRWDPDEYYLWTGSHIGCYIEKGLSADIKVPWELSRFQHLPTLGKAYWYTDDDRYAREFVSQIDGWISDNPPECGVNWACTMDVALRAISWVWGYHFFRDNAALPGDFRERLNSSLLLHGRHIRANLESGSRKGNHYLADIVGLLYLGIYFSDRQEGRRWLNTAYGALVKEMASQVHDDGVDFEGSIGYHGLVAELFLSATVLCTLNGLSFPEYYLKRLEKMLEFVAYYTRPDGSAPQIGDTDNGRAHILSGYSIRGRLDHRHLAIAGISLFGRSDLKMPGISFSEEVFWLLGAQGLKRFDGLAPGPDYLPSRAFPMSGFYVMRNHDSHMIIDALRVDKRVPSGHRHNSRLSFELSVMDRPFIADPGTYVYTPDVPKRNLFRSTRYHNTATVDHAEQSRYHEGLLFHMGSDANVIVNRWIVSDRYDLFDASHTGYMRLKDPVLHRRLIYFNKIAGYWMIKDSFHGASDHTIDLYFHFVPMDVALKEHYVSCRPDHKKDIIVMPLDDDTPEMNIIRGHVSPAYGIIMKAPILQMTIQKTLPFSMTSLIYPIDKNNNINEIPYMVHNDLMAKRLLDETSI